MLGEPENSFSLIRTALSTNGRAKSKSPSTIHMNTLNRNFKRISFSILLLLASSTSLLAQSPSLDETGGTGGGVVGILGGIIYLAVAVFIIASLWRVFTKAGQPGWACIIPIYNLFVLCKVAGRPGWWVLLCFIPLVNIVVGFILAFDVARKFGRGVGFGLGIAFLPFIFYPILGFGSATYEGSAA